MLILGQVTVPITTNWWSGFAEDSVKQVLVLLGAMGIVALFVVFWVVFIRKSSSHERRKYPKYPKYPEQGGRNSESGSSPAEDDDRRERRSSRRSADDEYGAEDVDEKSEPGARHYGRRHRTSEHRPRNPTLSETGGLPPLRDPGQPPPQ